MLKHGATYKPCVACRVAKAYVECGGLPPPFCRPGVPGRAAYVRFAARTGRGKPRLRKREQAPALHIMRGESSAWPMGPRMNTHRRKASPSYTEDPFRHGGFGTSSANGKVKSGYLVPQIRPRRKRRVGAGFAPRSG